MSRALQLFGTDADTSLSRQHLDGMTAGEVTSLSAALSGSMVGKVLPVDLCRARTLHIVAHPADGQVWPEAADTMASRLAPGALAEDVADAP